MPISSAAALMAPPLAGAAIVPVEPANRVAPAIRRAEHAILMTSSPLCARRIQARCSLNRACVALFRPASLDIDDSFGFRLPDPVGSRNGLSCDALVPGT